MTGDPVLSPSLHLPPRAPRRDVYPLDPAGCPHTACEGNTGHVDSRNMRFVDTTEGVTVDLSAVQVVAMCAAIEAHFLDSDSGGGGQSESQSSL
jgi:hypothetical protein